MSNSSIWPIKKTLTGAITLGHSVSRSVDYEGIPHISQSSKITEASPSDCLESYPGHLPGESYPSAEMQSVYSTASANWATDIQSYSVSLEIFIVYKILNYLPWLKKFAEEETEATHEECLVPETQRN